MELAHFCLGHNVDFHSYCHGGQRPKLTSRFWVFQDHFSQLSMFCDNVRWHKPWTPRKVGNRLRFVTADEAAYPLLLCQRLMDALLEICFPATDLHAAQTSIPFHDKSARIVLGIQPRGHVMGPLIPEFSHHVAYAPF